MGLINMDLNPFQSSLKIRILLQPPTRSGSKVLNPLPWRNQVGRLLGKMGLVNIEMDPFQSSIKIRILMQPPARSGSEVLNGRVKGDRSNWIWIHFNPLFGSELLNPLPCRNQVKRLLGKMGLVNIEMDPFQSSIRIRSSE